LFERVARLRVRVVAHADNEFVSAVAVKVREPHRVPPPQLLVDDVPFPLAERSLLARISDDLVAVPGFDGGDHRLRRVLADEPSLNFTRAAIALRVRLVSH